MDPVVAGELDVNYLRDALARAGISLAATDLTTEQLTGGRTAATVTRLRTSGDPRSFVLKVTPMGRWREKLGLGCQDAQLWLAGPTRTLPPGLRCPTIDVARHATRPEWWILMDDASDGIAGRGRFEEHHTRTLFRSLARLQARYWGRDDELAALPLARFAASADAFARLCVHVIRPGTVDAEPWLLELAEDFWVPGALWPPLFNAIPAADADFLIELCRDHASISRALATFPHTICHGDLRRANISYSGDDVTLFDWELSSNSPAARDLQWHMFLQYWAYPPDDGRTPHDRDHLLDGYVAALAEAGCTVDRPQFDAMNEIGWLSVLCQIGFCLGDALTGTPSPEVVTRAKRTIADAITRARNLRDRHVR